MLSDILVHPTHQITEPSQGVPVAAQVLYTVTFLSLLTDHGGHLSPISGIWVISMVTAQITREMVMYNIQILDNNICLKYSIKLSEVKVFVL